MFEPLHSISLTSAICPFPPSAHIIHGHTGLALRTAFQIPHLAHPPVSMFLCRQLLASQQLLAPFHQPGCHLSWWARPLQSEGSAQHQAVSKTLGVPTQMNKTCLFQMNAQMKEQWWPVPGVPSKHTQTQSPARTEPHTPSSA